MRVKIDIEKEKSMYAICFGILAICLSLLFFLSGVTPISILKPSIIGAVVLEPVEPDITEEGITGEGIVTNYWNISSENITQESALNAILQAEKDMQEMQEAGFGIVWVNDTLIEAKKYFEGEDYTELLKATNKIKDREEREKAKALLIEAQKKIGVAVDYPKVLEKTKAINKRKIKAYEINDYIRVAELRIEEIGKTGIDMTAAFELLDNAKIEFEEERYNDAIALLAQIEPKIEEIRSENTLLMTIYRAGKETAIGFIKEHYIGIIITLIILTVAGLLSYNRIMVSMLKRKIKDMDIEKNVLEELIKKAQKDYFSKGIIPKSTYEIKLSKYKEGLQQIKERLPVLQSRADKLAKMKRVV